LDLRSIIFVANITRIVKAGDCEWRNIYHWRGNRKCI